MAISLRDTIQEVLVEDLPPELVAMAIAALIEARFMVESRDEN